MNKCFDCKHWKNRILLNKPTDEFRTCVKLSLCDPIEGVTAEFGSEIEEEIIEDGFSTGKDFGCIHHKSN